MADLTEESKVPSKVKSWCPKCLMTFENGLKSQIVTNHRNLYDCDRFPCNKPGSTCVRRFRHINSANRHTYCYNREFVQTWSPNMKIQNEPVELDFGSLKLDDSEIDFLADSREISENSDNWTPEPPAKFFRNEEYGSPPYKVHDEATITELFDIVGIYLGREFSRTSLMKLKNGYKRLGFTSARVFRIVHENKGSWDYLYDEFINLGPEVTGVAHVLKKVLCEKADSCCLR